MRPAPSRPPVPSVVDRVVRPALLLVIAAGATVLLWRAGRQPEMRVDWGHLGSWLDRTSSTDAVLAIARVGGIVLALYCAAVTGLYLIAATTRVHWLGRLARAVALPPLRRLLDAVLASSILISAISAPVEAAARTPPAAVIANVPVAHEPPDGSIPVSVAMPAPTPPSARRLDRGFPHLGQRRPRSTARRRSAIGSDAEIAGRPSPRSRPGRGRTGAPSRR